MDAEKLATKEAGAQNLLWFFLEAGKESPARLVISAVIHQIIHTGWYFSFSHKNWLIPNSFFLLHPCTVIPKVPAQIFQGLSWSLQGSTIDHLIRGRYQQCLLVSDTGSIMLASSHPYGRVQPPGPLPGKQLSWLQETQETGGVCREQLPGAGVRQASQRHGAPVTPGTHQCRGAHWRGYSWK